MSIIVPTGFKFLPTDDELVKYLICKIRNEPLPCEGIISETDVFGDRPPWELFGGDDFHYDHGDVRYFFTELKKKTENSKKNMKRNVGDVGTWHGDTKGVGIKDPKTRQVIGNRKAFNFRLKDMRSSTSTSKRRRLNSDDSRWLMTEYSLDGVSLKYKKPGPDYVLCRIKKKNLLQKQQLEEDDCDSGMDDNAAADVVSGPPPTTFIPPTGSYNVSYRPQAEYSTNPASTTGEYCDINNCSNGLLQSYPQGILPDSSAAQAIGEDDYFFDDYIDVSLLINSEQPSTGVEDFNLDEWNLEGFGGELVLPPVGNEENINDYNLRSLPEYYDSTVQEAVGGSDSNDHEVDDNQLDDQTNSISRYLDEEFVENWAQLNGNGNGDGDGVNNVGASSSDRFLFEDTIVYVDPLW
ncbi:hypothetical protein LguiA_032966 [Lonicera macranthoides]